MKKHFFQRNQENLTMNHDTGGHISFATGKKVQRSPTLPVFHENTLEEESRHVDTYMEKRHFYTL